MKTNFATLKAVNVAGVLTVTIDNPPVNVMSVQMMQDLTEVAEAAAVDDAVKVIVLESPDPDFFIVHFDTPVVVHWPDAPNPRRAPDLSAIHTMCARFRENPKPSLVKLNGRAGGGGCELASSCDMRFGIRGKTILNQMEVPLGIIPGGSGCQNWVRHVGRGRALEVIIGGDDIDCDTAVQWGYLNRAFDDAASMDSFVANLAMRIAQWPSHAVALAKQAVDACDPSWRSDLIEEDFLVRQALTSPDARPLLQRFLDVGAHTRDGESRVAELSLEAARSYFGRPAG